MPEKKRRAKELNKNSLPAVDKIVEFFMQAEELTVGEHQKSVVNEVVSQFGDLMYHIEFLELKNKRLEASSQPPILKRSNSWDVILNTMYK